jgi:hypothetical protein
VTSDKFEGYVSLTGPTLPDMEVELRFTAIWRTVFDGRSRAAPNTLLLLVACGVWIRVWCLPRSLHKHDSLLEAL